MIKREKTQFAFTLSELLMAVLVVSIILVAAAPVITERLTDTISAPQAKMKGILFTYDENNLEGCTIDSDVRGTRQSDCTFRIPDDVVAINAIVVGKGGNGSGAQAGGEVLHEREIIELTYPDPFGASASVSTPNVYSVTYPATKVVDGFEYMLSNLKVEYMVSPGSGGGAGYVVEGTEGPPTSQEDCDPFDALYIPAEYNAGDGSASNVGYNPDPTGLCVTKFNVGDDPGPPLADNVDELSLGDECTSKYCCWKGQTADSAHCTSSSEYSACDRTVCTYLGARDSCAAWAPEGTNAGDWRLPEFGEIGGWILQMQANELTADGDLHVNNYLGANGLQLCDHLSANFGAPMCKPSEFCVFNGSKACQPSTLWDTEYGDTDGSDSGLVLVFALKCGVSVMSTRYDSDGNSCNATAHYRTPYRAYSARCVLDNIKKPSKLHGGAGGGAGSSITNVMIKEGILGEEINVNVMGSGLGVGAVAGGSSATNGGQIILVAVNNDRSFTRQISVTGTPTNGNAFGESGNEDGPGSSDNQVQATSYTIDGVTYEGPTSEFKVGKTGLNVELTPDYNTSYDQADLSPGMGGNSDAYWALFTSMSENNRSYTGGGLSGIPDGDVDGQNAFENSSILLTQKIKQEFILDDLGGTVLQALIEPEILNVFSDGDNILLAKYTSGSDDGTQWVQDTVTRPGAGGGGGAAKIDSSGNITLGNGGMGAPGLVILGYDLTPPLTPGAGGSGGGMASGTNIQVATGEEIKVLFNPTRLQIGENFTLEAATGVDANGETPGEFVGEGGSVEDLAQVPRTGTFNFTPGANGEEGKTIGTTAFLHGGLGGMSATGGQPSCGGLNSYLNSTTNETFINSQNCNPFTLEGNDVHGADGVVNVEKDAVRANNFGIAGSGGGGGGYGTSSNGVLTTGIGGEGGQGYVYIWWTEAAN